ncbi:MAG: hypothetical protein ACRYFW_00130 [Janthinobacterium lividum]
MQRHFVIRLVAVMLVAIPLAWMTFAFSLSLLLARSNPSVALRFWSGNSIARAGLADQLVAEAPAAPPAEARLQALEALREDPGNAVAARVLGTTAGTAGSITGLERWLAYSERYSRRDVSTQFGLIELAVSQGQIAGALAHYDRALRVFAPLPQILDVLVGATKDAPVRQQLAALLRRQPPWRQGYLIQLVESGHAPPDAVFAMLRLLRLDPADAFDRRILGEAVSLLAARNLVPEARALVGISGSGVRNGGFEAGNDYPPLDWRLADQPDLTGVIEQGSRAGGGNALFLDVHNDASGIVAEQLLSLAAGRYALSLVAGGIGTGGAMPAISVMCLEGAMPLASVALPTKADAVAVSIPAFTVTKDCPAQQLTITATAATDTSAPRSWIDDVKVVPVP